MVYPSARQTGAVCPSKRHGDDPRSRLGHDPRLSEAGNILKRNVGVIDKREKAYQEMAPSISDFVRDLDRLSDEGWCVLVEGARDQRAMRALGYEGGMCTVSQFARNRKRATGTARGVVILTDLDREGAVLAARFVKLLRHEGLRTSLNERRRLKAISRGVFLHIENLSRFGVQDA